jgi:hypothetical protein
LKLSWSALLTIWITAVAIGLTGTCAQAMDLYLSPAVTYRQDKTADQSLNAATPTIVTDMATFTVDGRAGLSFGGFYLGGLYKYQNFKDNVSSVITNGFAAGPSLGYMAPGFNLLGTYITTGEFTSATAGVIKKYQKGSGFQIDLGFFFPLWRSFGFGPQLSYCEINYAKSSDVSGNDLNTTRKVTQVSPYLAFYLAL